MSNRPKDPKNARNKNILVIGGSGSGKTRFFCKPNIMQLHSSYVITDPKGSLICEVGQLLQRARYRIAVLNTINFSKSMHYNPFAYLRTEKDILKLVNTIIVNTKDERRDLPLRKQRPSVRAQLKKGQSKKTAAPKKAAAKAKDNDLEV